MPFLQLQPHAGYGLAAGRAVFLDLKRDRYLALDPVCEALIAALRDAPGPEPVEGEALEKLLRTGLFRTSALPVRPLPEPIAIPPSSLLDAPLASDRSWRAAPGVWAAVARARRRLADEPLETLVMELRERRRAVRADDPAQAERLARRFLAARALVPIGRSCLLDSLALLDWLGARSGRAILVFGVRIDPFGAHCWVQTQDMILTDAADTILNFAPVLSA